ncbi:hypothetical protein [Faecalibacterium sp. An192]|uniref:hypothetical protein n=1 Tax=Faecalibacterium sp. An192 TaxID=1965581 RepID=UPI000B3A6BD1|nr:hypothetical protein [Faecalibacterium sp. An192]OUP26161.1 hypothetical protein B5F27_14460 [Faecalibacterium sp. An192]
MDTSSANKSSQEKQTKKLTDLLLQQTPQDINEQTFRDRFREDARKNWMANSEQYRNLLTTYVNNIDDNLKSKRCQKKVFFWLSVLILLGVTGAIIYIIYQISISPPDIIVLLLQVVTALTAFLTPLLVLPKTIVNYLFTTKDEEYMIQIIEQIIRHDDSSLEK